MLYIVLSNLLFRFLFREGVIRMENLSLSGFFFVFGILLVGIVGNMVFGFDKGVFIVLVGIKFIMV